jgi:hypothetical protein
MAGHHAQPHHDQKSGQFLVRTQNKKHRSELTERQTPAMLLGTHLAQARRGLLPSAVRKSGHILVRTHVRKKRKASGI